MWLKTCAMAAPRTQRHFDYCIWLKGNDCGAFSEWDAKCMTRIMHKWRREEVTQEHKWVQSMWERRKGESWEGRGERRSSVPQLLLESASVATAWLTVYLQQTVICGYLNLELDLLRKGGKKLKWNWDEKIQEQQSNDVPGRCRAWRNKVSLKMSNYRVWRKKLIHRQSSREIEFIIKKKDGQEQVKMLKKKVKIRIRPAAAKRGYFSPHEPSLLGTPVAESATRSTASIAVPQSHYVRWQLVVRW